jgi:predicted XRE-type DNA-binding protein
MVVRPLCYYTEQFRLLPAVGPHSPCLFISSLIYPAQMKRENRVSNVWDALADSPSEAASLRIRAELMDQIAVLVEKKGWTQAEAAKRCGISQPRMSDLLRGRISKFSLDALVDAATALGCRVRLELRAA